VTSSSKGSFKKYFYRLANFSDKNTRMISVIFALAVTLTLLVYNYKSVKMNQEHINFYVLDPNKRAENYPEVLVIGKNNTCRLWIVIENYMERKIAGKVFLKVMDKPVSAIPVPVKANVSYDVEVENGRSWEKQVEIVIEKTGRFTLVFELWVFNAEVNKLEFYHFIVLPIDVIEA